MNTDYTIGLGHKQHTYESLCKAVAHSIGLDAYHTDAHVYHIVGNITNYIMNENIVIPLNNSFMNHKPSYRKDRRGFREYGCRIIRGSDFAKYMNLPDNIYSSLRVPISKYCNIDCDINACPSFIETEDYSMLLNVSYLIDECSLNEWIQGYEPKSKRISMKKVGDCTISELLFAVRQKLEI